MRRLSGYPVVAMRGADWDVWGCQLVLILLFLLGVWYRSLCWHVLCTWRRYGEPGLAVGASALERVLCWRLLTRHCQLL